MGRTSYLTRAANCGFALSAAAQGLGTNSIILEAGTATCGLALSAAAQGLGTNSIILEAGTDADRRLKQAFEAAVLARAPKPIRPHSDDRTGGSGTPSI